MHIYISTYLYLYIDIYFKNYSFYKKKVQKSFGFSSETLPFQRGWWCIYLSLTSITASPLAALHAQLPSYLSWPGRTFTALLLLIHLCLLSITLRAGWDLTCHPLPSHTFHFHLLFPMEHLHLTTLPLCQRSICF